MSDSMITSPFNELSAALDIVDLEAYPLHRPQRKRNHAGLDGEHHAER